MTTTINKLIHLFNDLPEDVKRQLQIDMHLVQQVTAASDGETIYAGAPKAPIEDRIRAAKALAAISATLMTSLNIEASQPAKDDVSKMSPKEITKKRWSDRGLACMSKINAALAITDQSFGYSFKERAAIRLHDRVASAVQRESTISMESIEEDIERFVKECNNK